MMRKILILIILAVHAAAPWAAPVVAVASNMTHVMTDIAAKYRQETGKTVKLTFGSSGNFTRQIQQGAPYTVFVSAAGKYVDILQDNGLLQKPPVIYARGQIGLFIPKTSPLYKDADLHAVFNDLYYDNYRRIAIANPDHAPYGVAAEQALQSGGLWAIEKKKLLIAEDAAQVVQYVLTGGVDLGIIPASFAHLPLVNENGRFISIPADWHKPIQQYLALIKGAGADSDDFYDYLLGNQAKTLLRNSGYTFTEKD